MKEPYFVIDVAKCENCKIASSRARMSTWGTTGPATPRPQPNAGPSWIRIEDKERGEYPMIDVAYLPVPCMHCADPPCARAAKDGCNLQETGRHRDDRPSQSQRAETDSPCLPLPCDRLERRNPSTPEMYDVRPPPRQGVDQDAVHPVLSDGALEHAFSSNPPTWRPSSRPEGLEQLRPRKEPDPGSTTGISTATRAASSGGAWQPISTAGRNAWKGRR